MQANTKHKAHTGADHNNQRMDDLREEIGTVGEAFKDMAHTVGAAATDQLDPLTEYIKRNPLRAALLAAGAGAVLGLFLFRRH